MHKPQTKARYVLAFCYFISLLPLFLPWCYFDKETDGIKTGIDIINPKTLLALGGFTLFHLLSAKSRTGKAITRLLLLLHIAMYLISGLLWYVPLVTDFHIILSLEAMHYGFYLSLLCSGSMYFLYRKIEKKDNSYVPGQDIPEESASITEDAPGFSKPQIRR